MAAPGFPSSEEGLANQLSFAQRTLEQHHTAVQKIMDQHYGQIQSLLEGARLAAEQTPTPGARLDAEQTPTIATEPMARLRKVAFEGAQKTREVTPLVPLQQAECLQPKVIPSKSEPAMRRSATEPVSAAHGDLVPHNVAERVRRMKAIAHVLGNIKSHPSFNDADAIQTGRKTGWLNGLARTSQNDSVDSTAQEGVNDCTTPDPLRRSITPTRRAKQTKPNRKTFAARAVFGDREEMKENVRKAIGKPKYAVTQFYKEEGVAQQIARSQWFESITLGVIVVNALWLSFDMDLNHADIWLNAHPVFAVMENAFCAFFLAEVLIRFSAFKVKRNCFRDPWFVFDSLLVIFMIMDCWVLAIITHFAASGKGGAAGANVEMLRLVRLLRLTRMARLARLLRATPELMILVKGMAVGFRSVCSTLSFLMILIYIFAIIFRMMGKDTNLEALGFRSVPQTMLTLLARGVLDLDLYVFTYQLVEVEIIYAVLLYCFILFASITVMNMLVGVLVEVVGVVSSVEKEQIEVNFVRENLEQMIENIGQSHTGTISKAEFTLLLERPEAIKALLSIDVDVIGLIDFTDYIFENGLPITFGAFMELLLELRGSNKARVKDMVDLRKVIMQEFMRLETLIAPPKTD